jgi:hypothetical protein
MRQIILLFLIFVFSLNSVSAVIYDVELSVPEIKSNILNVQKESTLSPTIKNGVASQ